LRKLDSDSLGRAIRDVESCLSDVDKMGLTRIGAILDTALNELKALADSLDALDKAVQPRPGCSDICNDQT